MMTTWLEKSLAEIESLEKQMDENRKAMNATIESDEFEALIYRMNELREALIPLVAQTSFFCVEVLSKVTSKSQGMGKDELIDLIIAAENGTCIGSNAKSFGSYPAEVVEGMLKPDEHRYFRKPIPQRAWKYANPDQLPQVVAFHGLTFLSKLNVIKKAEVAMSAIDICVADTPLGGIGLIVRGGVRVAFSGDCSSTYCSRTGIRVAEAYSYDNVVQGPTQEEYEALASRDVVEYSEGWMKPSECLGVFIADSASDEEVGLAKELADKYGVKTVRVSECTRIGEVLTGGLIPR